MFKYILILLLLASCASNDLKEMRSNEAIKKQEEELKKEFNFNIPDVSSSEVKTESDTKVSSPVKVAPKKRTTSKANTKSSAKNIKSQNVAPKSEIKTEEKSKEIPERQFDQEVVELKPFNPEAQENYPEQFKAYNKKYAKYWANYKPHYKKGERFTFNVSWSIFKAGDITLETLGKAFIGQTPVVGYRATMESADYFESIYKLKDLLEVYINEETQMPIKYSLIQRESGQSVDDLQLFDGTELKTYFSYHRIKDGKNTKKKEEKFTPKYFLDSFSVLHFIRGLDLKVGYKFEIPVITRAKVWILKAEVDEIENIEVMGKTISAYKIKAETQFPGVLKKSGDINFWYSADESKKLLRFEAKVKIGTVKGILTQYQE